MSPNDKKRKILKLIRKHFDMTQDIMAEKLGMSTTHYCNIENGLSNCRWDFLAKQGEIFGYDMFALAGIYDNITEDNQFNKRIIAEKIERE